MASIHVYKDTVGEWRFRIKAENGKITADSGEGYSRKGNAARAARNLIIDLTQKEPVITVDYVQPKPKKKKSEVI